MPKGFLSACARDIVYNVYHYFKHQYDVSKLPEDKTCDCINCCNVSSLKNPIPIAVFAASENATNVKKKYIFRIRKQYHKRNVFDAKGLLQDIQTPTSSKNETLISTSERVEVRKTIDYFLELYKLPVLDQVLTALQKKNQTYTIERILQILEIMGFCQEDWNDKRIIFEKVCYLAQRSKYLRQLTAGRQSESVVFVDTCWISRRGQVGRLPDHSKNVVLVMYARLEEGPLKVFKVSEVKAMDNSEKTEESRKMFIKWWSELLPKLPNSCTLSIGNYDYILEKVQDAPTDESTRNTVETWLLKEGIQFDSEMTRSQLLMLVEKHRKGRTKYIAEVLAERAGHKVLLIPSNVPELSPISLVWEHLETWLRSNHGIKTLKDLRETCLRILEDLRDEEWTRFISSSRKLEDDYKQFDQHLEQTIEGVPPNRHVNRNENISDW